MRVLFDSSICNINHQGGGSLAVLAYLNAVLELFPERVDVVTAQECNMRDSRFDSIDVAKRSNRGRNIGFLQGKFYRSADFIVDYVKKNFDKYELIFFNGGLHSGYAINKLRKLGIKIVVFHHNYEPEYQLASKSIISFKGRTDFWVKVWESKAYRYSTANLFISPEDKELFEKAYGKRDNNYFIGIYEPQMVNIEKPKEGFEKSMAITCSLCAYQNLLSLRRFKEKYIDIYHDILPDWELKIMGRDPSNEIIDWATEYPFVKVFPSPENIRELCSQSPVYLCQMDDGGGLKLRVMDGLRNGQPVLTHRVSARGYNAFFNEPFFKVYDDEESFVRGLKEITEYVKSDEFSKEYVQKRYYEEFGFDIGVERLKNILHQIEY